MSKAPQKNDLLVLVADADMQATLQGVLSRCPALGIREPTSDIRRHPQRDSGCRAAGVEYLRPFMNQYEHALLLLDREGCGQEGRPADDIERELKEDLASSGWKDRASVIVLVPELEVWIWSDSPQVDEVLGWSGRTPSLRGWLENQGFWPTGQQKPNRPKEALERVLRDVQKPRSSAIYYELARRVGFQRCADPAFKKLTTTLQTWFSLQPRG